MKRFFLAYIVFLTSTIFTFAAKVQTRPYTSRQQDGSYLTVYGHGDEKAHWYTTADDALLVQVGNNYYIASIDKDGYLQATNHLAHNASERSAEEQEVIDAQDKDVFLQRINSVLTLSANAKATTITRATTGYSSPVLGTATPSYFPHTGTPKALVILVEFQDTLFKAKAPKEVFNYFLNASVTTPLPADFATTMINENYGSVYQYFYDMSAGQFTPQFDIVGPVKLKQSSAYYGKNNSYGNDVYYEKMIMEACSMVNDSVDFSQYDADGDGCVDLVYIIYAGYSESLTGNSSDYIWPKSGVSSLGTYDGVKVRRYGINNELNFTPTKQSSDGRFYLNGIGLFCHEFSHTLGLPDLYPTVSTWNGQQSMEYWDLMDGGEYNDDGYTPCPYTPWELNLMGWTILQELDSTEQQITLPSYDQQRIAYKIAGANGESIIIQNIQTTGWWGGMLGHGMLVYRVDYPYATVTLNDYPNNNAARPALTIVPADGKLISYYDKAYKKEEYEASHQGDPFPGTSNVTTLLSVKLNRSTLTRPMYNIKEENSNITFDYLKDYTVAGIQNPQTNFQKQDKRIFSIDGKYMGTDASKLQRGIYIIDGKKVVIL